MRKVLLITSLFFLMSCASKPSEDEKISVTGTRISKEDAKKLNLKPVGTIGALLKAQMAEIPQVTADMTCKDLLKMLENKGIEVTSVTESKIIAITTDKKQLKYTFNNGGCL